MKTKDTHLKEYQKTAVAICRIVVGLVFIFSGFVKAVDPWGFAYKISDYLAVWDFSFFDFLALPASFFLSAFEFTLGVCLLTGIYRKIVSWLTFLFMCFMTVFTLYLAIFNPVSDCGCFGDALIISNWQTFYKNVVLIIATFFLFLWYRRMPRMYSRKYRLRVVVVIVAFILSVSTYCVLYLPVLDFRPYKIGNNIPELMQIPKGANSDVYETTLVYEKDGVRQDFTMTNYPKENSNWTFVEAINVLIKKGYEPPIHDFTIRTDTGDDITDEVLADEGYTFLLIATNLEKADDANIANINSVYDYSVEHGYRFLCLTASIPYSINEWKESTGAEYPFCTTDGITLKTIIRSNPGLMLIKGGVIINKWPGRCIPGDADLQVPLENSALGVSPANHDVRNVLLLALALFIPLLIIWILNQKNKKK